MSAPLGKKYYNIDQPIFNAQLLTGGPSLALGATATGADVLTETEGLAVNIAAGNATTPKGFVAGVTNSMSESITSLTVV